MTRLWLCCIYSLLLTGCAVQNAHTARFSPLPITAEQVFAPAKPIISPDELLQLSPVQQQQFLSFFNQAELADAEPNRRLEQYLQQYLTHFSYEGVNLTASTALEQRNGNCMSLALAVMALAKIAKVDVSYRATYSEPMMGTAGDFMLSSSHVRSYLFAERQANVPNEGLLLRSAIAIDYFKEPLDRLGAVFGEPRFFAMFYNNLASDAMIAGDLDQAYWLSQRALSFDHSYGPSLNLIAVIYRRKNDLASATQWFEYGLTHSDNPLILASNYLLQAKAQGDLALQQRITQLINVSEVDDPYSWFYLAVQFAKEGDNAAAIHYYEKLFQTAPYLHQANLALAKLYLQTNRPYAAARLLRQGMQYAYAAENKKMYQHKLQWISQQTDQATPP